MNPEKPSREEIELKITALLLGELPDDEAQLLRYVIAQDAALKKLHDELASTIVLVREAVKTPAETSPPLVAPLKLSCEKREKLLAHFKTVAPREFAPQKNRSEISRLLEIAAALALIAVLAAMLLPSLAASKRKAQQIYAMNQAKMADEKLKLGNDEIVVDKAEPAAPQAFAVRRVGGTEGYIQLNDTTDKDRENFQQGSSSVVLARPSAMPAPPQTQIVLPAVQNPNENASEINGQVTANNSWSTPIVGYGLAGDSLAPQDIGAGNAQHKNVAASSAPQPQPNLDDYEPVPAGATFSQMDRSYYWVSKSDGTRVPADASQFLDEELRKKVSSQSVAANTAASPPPPADQLNFQDEYGIAPDQQTLDLHAANSRQSEVTGNGRFEIQNGGGARTSAEQAREQSIPVIVGNSPVSSPTVAMSGSGNLGGGGFGGGAGAAFGGRGGRGDGGGAGRGGGAGAGGGAGGGGGGGKPFAALFGGGAADSGNARDDSQTPVIGYGLSGDMTAQKKLDESYQNNGTAGTAQISIGSDTREGVVTADKATEEQIKGVLKKLDSPDAAKQAENKDRFLSDGTLSDSLDEKKPMLGDIPKLDKEFSSMGNMGNQNEGSFGQIPADTQADEFDAPEIATSSTTASSTVSGYVDVGGQLIKSGAGTVTLNGANTFTGETTVNGGTLNFSTSAANPLGAFPGNTAGDSFDNSGAVALNENEVENLGTSAVNPQKFYSGLTRDDVNGLKSSGSWDQNLTSGLRNSVLGSPQTATPPVAMMPPPPAAPAGDVHQERLMAIPAHALDSSGVYTVGKLEPAAPVAAESGNGITFNFHNAMLADVLSYMSDVEGFTIAQDASANARVTIINSRPMSKDEAVEALNSALNQNNLVAVSDGQTLTIMDKNEAKTGNIPVIVGNVSTNIPPNNAIVTQIVPIRFGNAEQIVKDIASFVSPQTTIEANAAGNSIVITDTRANVRHLAEIIKAIDNDQAKPSPATNAPVPQPEFLTSENSFSTFSLNVADVSFKLAAASLQNGQLPDAASIRSEEFINAFNYHDPEPAAGVPVAFVSERAQDPFAQNRDLLRFSIKTAALGRRAGRPLNIVLLLDNSGSMERADRVAIIHEALDVLAKQLQPQDTLSIVTFARTARLWVDGVSGDQAQTAVNKVSGLTPEGGTNLEEAMNLAYQTALRHYLANGGNRVVLLTDGAANLGNVDPEALKQKVESFRKQGIALDCFGIGFEDYNDDLLEQLSSNGDGRYAFINSPDEADTDFAAKLAGALQVAAEDVKVQVEFNPQRVVSWRQVGYAKHQLTKEQFRDNTVAAAPMAAQEAGNALYTVEINPQGAGPVATVRARFRVPGTQEVSEHAWDVPYTGDAPALEQSSPAMRLAATAGEFSEWLAASQFAQEVTPDELQKDLTGVPQIYGADPRPKQLETMIREAKSAAGSAQPAATKIPAGGTLF